MTAAPQQTQQKQQNDMLNIDVCLTGHNVVLVPYLKHHVRRYHDWLSREDILEATCSEPQTLDEEYENQISWMESDDKMTFIILSPLSVALPELEDRKRLILSKLAASSTSSSGSNGSNAGQFQSACVKDDVVVETEGSPLDVFGTPVNLTSLIDLAVSDNVPTTSSSPSSPSSCFSGDSATSSSSSSSSSSLPPLPSCLESVAKDRTNDFHKYNPLVMIGDCNLFKMPIHHTSEGEVEVSVMLAESRFRGKGLAREAVGLLMSYAYEKLKRSSFIAKILASNNDSRNLFEKGSLGFTLFKEVKAFDEIHYLKRLRPFLSAEHGGEIDVIVNTDGEEVVVAPDNDEGVIDTVSAAAVANTAAATKKAAVPIRTIDELKAAVGYKRYNDYTPERCERGRTIALTNETEREFY